MKTEIGLGLLALAGIQLIHSVRLNRRSQSATGRIVSFTTSVSSDPDRLSNSTNYLPRIEFRTPDGTTHECGGASNSRKPKIGTKVKVVYDPLDPGAAWEKGSVGHWAAPILLTIAGVVLVVLGLRGR